MVAGIREARKQQDQIEVTDFGSVFLLLEFPSLLMSVWLPRAGPTIIARSYSRSIYTSRSHLILQCASRPSLAPPRSLAVLPRYQSSNSTSATSQPSAEAKSGPPAPKEPPKGPLAARVWKKVKHEAQHYWHGSKLLVSEVRISSRLQWKILQGDTLTRRERRQVSWSST